MDGWIDFEFMTGTVTMEPDLIVENHRVLTQNSNNGVISVNFFDFG